MRHPVSPQAMLRALWQHRELIGALTRREVASRYRGAMLGQLWPLLSPLLMLGIYTFVFGVVFNARWGLPQENTATFAVVLFAGILVHGILSETLGRAPMLILGHANYVKRVVFPLEILPVVTLGAALIHALIGFSVLLVAAALAGAGLSWQTLWLPVLLLPFVLLVQGCAWLLAALGVYLRDIGQVIQFVITAMMFLSPIFYKIDVLPETYRPWLFLNPLTLMVEEVRAVIFAGRMPDWSAMLPYSALALLVCWLGFVFFQKTRNGFADVL